jgi:hypothetical protein
VPAASQDGGRRPPWQKERRRVLRLQGTEVA